MTDQAHAMAYGQGATSPNTDEGRLPLTLCIGWGIGTIATAALFNAVNILLLRYLVDIVGMGAALAGGLVALSKLYDAIIDPLVGVASDRTRSRAGRRRPWLLAGAVLLAAGGLALFNVPGKASVLSTVWVAAALILYSSGYAAFSVPYMAMPAEMTARADDRARMISWRVLAVAVASLLASFFGPVLIARGGGGQGGHSTMAMVMATITIVAGIACFRMTGSAQGKPASEAKGESLMGHLRVLIDSKPFTILLGVKLLQLMALAVTQAATPFLFKGVLQVSDSFMGTYFGLFYLAMILSQPIALRLARIATKRTLLIGSTLIYALVYSTWFFVEPGDPIVTVLLRGALAGFFGGAGLLFGQALLPEAMDWDARRSGVRREGYLAGLYTLVEKLAYALGPALAGLLLGLNGYVSGGGASAVAQPAGAILALYWLGSFIPFGLLVGSAVLLLGLRLEAD